MDISHKKAQSSQEVFCEFCASLWLLLKIAIAIGVESPKDAPKLHHEALSENQILPV